jgi:putative hemolysin
MPDVLLPESFQRVPAPVLGALKKLTGLDGLQQLYNHSQSSSAQEFAARALERLGIACDIGVRDRGRIPRSGGAILVANHPYGLLEGFLLTNLLAGIRPDVKFLANGLLAEIPELTPIVIPVDVFGSGEKATQVNRRSLVDSIHWLRNGGMLVIFPAGIVSSWDWRQTSVTDAPWNRSAARLASMTKAPVIPAYFVGQNSVPFHLMGLIHPALRTMRLPAELMNKRGTRIEIRTGNPVDHKELAQSGETPEQQTEYLRGRTYLLAFREQVAAALRAKPVIPRNSVVVPAIPAGELEGEIARLQPQQLLDQSGAYEVYAARTRDIPAVLTEIGRLREVTFRLAGEGTGRSTDLDSFDSYYDHIFVWHRGNRELAGAYRLARTTPILEWRGVRGLYTSTLFRYRPEFFKRIGPAIELGRSFVRPEYQKEYSPLLLLWKGIAKYAASNPGFPVLFGAVSISNDYSPAARQLMVEYLRRQTGRDPLQSLMRPRHPFRAPLLGSAELKRIAASASTLDSLSAAVGEMESGARGVPVLLRQYGKLGGRVLGFNVDHDFAGALDGLILVDLRTADSASLKRYMGSGTFEVFQRQVFQQQHHRRDEQPIMTRSTTTQKWFP